MAKDPPTVEEGTAKKEGARPASPQVAESAAPEDETREDESADLRRKNEELVARLKYLQADFENYRKRTEREIESLVKFAHEVLLSRLLPVLDEMDSAVAALEGKSGDGVRLVRDNLVKALQEAGLQEIPAKGGPFDPYVHDCVQQVPDSGSKDGVIKEVVRKGYRLHDRILRPAQVIVVKNGGETNA